MGKERKGSQEMDPNDWVRQRFPEVIGKDEEPILFREGGTATILSPFKLAKCLGTEGSPDAPIRFAHESKRFYGYSPKEGIYEELSEREVHNRIFELLEECAKATGLRGAKASRSLQRPGEASAVCGALEGRERFPDPARHRDLRYVHVQNGIVDLKMLRLREFSPSLPSAWKLPVPFLTDSPIPRRFWEMMERLFPRKEDRDLAIELLASAFLGNPFQRFMLLTGHGNTGKSSLIRLLGELLGPGAATELRLSQIKCRFTAATWAGRLLLYVPEFTQTDLNSGISALKAISGHDPMVAEQKYSSEFPTFIPRALPVLLTNEHVVLNAGPSRGSLSRRLVAFDVPKPSVSFDPQPDFVEQLIREEGPSILRIFLTEAYHLRRSKKLRPLTPRQLRLNDEFLGTGDPLLRWAMDHVGPHQSGSAICRDDAISSAEKWLEKYSKEIPASVTAWTRRLKPVVASMGGTWSQSLDGSGKGWRGVSLI